MKWLATILVSCVLAGCTGAVEQSALQESSEPTPRFDGERLVLSPCMIEALAREGTRFRTRADVDYIPLMISEAGERAANDTTPGSWPHNYPERTYPADSLHRPWALLGDFDGDGWLDAALVQSTPDSARVVVVSCAPGTHVIELRRWSRVIAGDLTNPSDFYLTRAPAGPLSVPDSAGGGKPTTVTLADEGITLAHWGTAAQTFYWQDDHFERLTTAD